MNRVQIFILVIFVTGAGIGTYLYLQKQKDQKEKEAEDQANQAAVLAAAQLKAKQDFCNPPIANSFERLAYQKKIAEAEWDKRGRGMSLDYFFEQFKKEMGCF